MAGRSVSTFAAIMEVASDALTMTVLRVQSVSPSSVYLMAEVVGASMWPVRLVPGAAAMYAESMVVAVGARTRAA